MFSSLGGLPLPYEAVGFSAKKISISATVLLRCSNVRILAPRSFSLISGFRLLWHIFTASSCAGGCSHFMLMSRHLLMKSIADSFLFFFKDMSSARVTLLSVARKRSKNFLYMSSQPTIELGFNRAYHWKAGPYSGVRGADDICSCHIVIRR
ncbi:hypothetical protein Taro_040390, partial [Colocasia esculenta]|nr:hypothetical protein [Colocasia esculenta]